ncbi:hypothetical protein [Massilia sp. MS-15]|uniref:hypothetical protein n=1 Tax=Massilia sp. MS-15 TaxID=2878200 RepID=UPI001CD1EB41|nr:hypothetical protein [Massilia sp. MS-15]MCA1248634.1 hypothetical protein [Massilia sp. MS-15]
MKISQRLRRVGGSPAHAVIADGSALAPGVLAADNHRVGGVAAHPTAKANVDHRTQSPVKFSENLPLLD